MEKKDLYPDYIPHDYVGPGGETQIVLRMIGTSMDRVAPSGTVVTVDYRDTQLQDGKYYVISHDGTLSFRLYRADPDRFEPDSTDPDYPTLIPDATFAIMGRVIRIIHRV